MVSKFSVWFVASLFIVMLACCASIGHFVSSHTTAGNGDGGNSPGKSAEILLIAQKNYFDDSVLSRLDSTKVDGLISNLDPFTKYLPPSDVKRDAENYGGLYEGIGVQLFSLNDTIIVTEVNAGGPARDQGILPNDRIVCVNDTSIVGATVGQVSRTLCGEKGTSVKLTIVRRGNARPLNFTIGCEDVPLPSVDAVFMLTPTVGYLGLNGFIETTHEEIDEALHRLKDDGMQQLLLDLRGNPGGYVHEAVQLADLFLDGGSFDRPRLIVRTETRNKDLAETHYAKDGDEFEHTPLVVLVDSNTASASEIFTGAIQDWDRGLIVGETTFGKGLVQRTWSLDNGSSVRLTIGKYHTPSGRVVQRPFTGKVIDHSQSGIDSAHMMFRTVGGRKVYGGGGITPDYVVDQYGATMWTQDVLRNDLLREFVSSYLDAHGSEIRIGSTSAADLTAFEQSFQNTSGLIHEFSEFLHRKDIPIEAHAFAVDIRYIGARLKAQIAQSFWGYQGWSITMASVDPQIQKALTLFPEAQRMMERSAQPQVATFSSP